MRVVRLMDEPDWQSPLSPIEEIFFATSPSVRGVSIVECFPKPNTGKRLDIVFRKSNRCLSFFYLLEGRGRETLAFFLGGIHPSQRGDSSSDRMVFWVSLDYVHDCRERFT
jgi:hypothetical protein